MASFIKINGRDYPCPRRGLNLMTATIVDSARNANAVVVGQVVGRFHERAMGVCEDVLAQINAAKSALHGCGKVVLEGHIKHCVRDGIEHGDADKTIESFTKAVERFSNMG